MADEAMPYTTYSMLLAHRDFLRERVEALEKALQELEDAIHVRYDTELCDQGDVVRLRNARAAARELLEGK